MMKSTATTTRKVSSPRRWMAAVAIGAAAITTPVLLAAPAQAATGGKIDMNSVCKDQGYAYATWERAGDPYSWRCMSQTTTIGTSPSVAITPGPGLDTQAWCNRNYPGTGARATDPSNVDSWFCVVG